MYGGGGRAYGADELVEAWAATFALGLTAELGEAGVEEGGRRV